MTHPIHRNGDSRTCGASTVVVGNRNVYVNNRLVSVDGDPNNHGAGNLKAATRQVFVNNKMVVNVGDSAKPDRRDHPNPAAKGGSPNVEVGD